MNKWTLLDEIGSKLTRVIRSYEKLGRYRRVEPIDVVDDLVEIKDLVNKLKSELINRSKESDMLVTVTVSIRGKVLEEIIKWKPNATGEDIKAFIEDEASWMLSEHCEEFLNGLVDSLENFFGPSQETISNGPQD